jgi:hypothetical protein
MSFEMPRVAAQAEGKKKPPLHLAMKRRPVLSDRNL